MDIYSLKNIFALGQFSLTDLINSSKVAALDINTKSYLLPKSFNDLQWKEYKGRYKISIPNF